MGESRFVASTRPQPVSAAVGQQRPRHHWKTSPLLRTASGLAIVGGLSASATSGRRSEKGLSPWRDTAVEIAGPAAQMIDASSALGVRKSAGSPLFPTAANTLPEGSLGFGKGE